MSENIVPDVEITFAMLAAGRQVLFDSLDDIGSNQADFLAERVFTSMLAAARAKT